MPTERSQQALHRVRARAVVWMIVALGAGIVAAYLVAQTMDQRQPAAAQVDTQDVVVARQDVAPGVRITAEDLELVEWPADLVPADSFVSPDEAIGKVVGSLVFAGEPPTARRLAGQETRPGPAVSIPPNMRAMSVSVNEVVGVAGFLRPDDVVDVITVMLPNLAAGDDQPRARVILQAVRVLAVGARFTGSEAKREQNQAMPATVATLLVTPGNAERLALAAHLGRIWLALRSPEDLAEVETPGVDHAQLLVTSTPPPPVRKRAKRAVTRAAKRAPVAAKKTNVVEVFHGRELEKRKIEAPGVGLRPR